MSRRVLSENSDVSPRYLAQLESGEGNISIGLLQRVAQALDCRIEWLIGEDDPWDTDCLQILDRYREASEDVREQVRSALCIDPASYSRAGRICLGSVPTKGFIFPVACDSFPAKQQTGVG